MPQSVATTNRGRIRPRPESSNLNGQPPQWILDKILGLLEERSGGKSWHLEEISQAKSAQQEVFLLKLANENCTAETSTSNSDNGDWMDSLRWGKQRLVLRIWRGGSRWWNLNRNEDPLELAKFEIYGYRIAYQALEDYHDNNSVESTQSRLPRIPRVLHFHLPKPTTTFDQNICWAVLEYVGADENDCLSVGGSDHKSNSDNVEYKVDRSFLEGMIKIRTEFGFEEPHPRWGRVPVDEALEYALSITKQFLLPLHSHSRKLNCKNRSNPQPSQSKEVSDVTNIKSFSCMVELYRKAWKETSATIQNLKQPTQSNSRIEECLQYLDKGITFLSTITKTIPPLDPVLLHLDLQPQNLIFYQHTGLANSTVAGIFSILDWEDAAFGDPRFDLVLMCRKVCANREQADALWAQYALALAGDGSVTGNYYSKNEIDKQPCGTITSLSEKLVLLGPIEPWLYLETVHSITTMLLQSMDLVNGGRNPWETKKNLWGKLEREFQRLEFYKAWKQK